jgi:hypothetical protein
MRRHTRLLFRLALLISIFPMVSFAQDFSSTNFTVQNPIIAPGGFSSSANFNLLGVFSQFSIGTSTAAAYGINAGFLYYPFVSTPAVSATPGDTQVSLTWTASDAALGLSVSGYAVGQSTASGGPYSFTSVGNVLSSIRTGLTNGTPYYIVIRVLDALGNAIATSTQVSATPAGSGIGTGTGTGTGAGGGGGGGGSGGGGSQGNGASVNFTGRAYPFSTVVLLKDGQIAVSSLAGGDAKFSISVKDLSASSYVFAVYGTDKRGNKSASQSFPLTMTANTETNVGGIFIAPTIETDKSEVKKGDNITFFGQSAADGNVTISVHSDKEVFLTTKSDKDGIYLYTMDTSPLSLGAHAAKSKVGVASEVSNYGATVAFTIGLTSIAKQNAKCIKADLNCDGYVNLVDFSIMAYWYKRPLTGKGFDADLNTDKKVDLVDFSILMYYWTG